MGVTWLLDHRVGDMLPGYDFWSKALETFHVEMLCHKFILKMNQYHLFAFTVYTSYYPVNTYIASPWIWKGVSATLTLLPPVPHIFGFSFFISTLSATF